MQIVLPGALPDAAIAPAIAAEIGKHAPHFSGWLSRVQANIIPALPADTLCTPDEYWMLRHHGLELRPQQAPAAGLAPLYARAMNLQVEPEKPLWLGQLVHVAPARDGAALIPASELAITPDESVALFDSAAAFLEGTGFEAGRFDDLHWRIFPPGGFEPSSASPALVSTTAVNDWWTQDVEGRPWRRLVNELQMLWFDHPVNQAREAKGLRPVNSVWLYGGAAPNQLRVDEHVANENVRVLRALYGPALVQDWGSWLQTIAQLDREVFSTMAEIPQLVLTGKDRIVELSPMRPSLIGKLLRRKQDWRQWWSASV